MKIEINNVVKNKFCVLTKDAKKIAEKMLEEHNKNWINEFILDFDWFKIISADFLKWMLEVRKNKLIKVYQENIENEKIKDLFDSYTRQRNNYHKSFTLYN